MAGVLSFTTSPVRDDVAEYAPCRARSTIAGRAAVPSPPRATYRLQFNSSFGLLDALALAPYLSELGVSHIYASPLLKACPGSTHGYDVCDFNALNPNLGSEEDLARLVGELRRRGMGLVLDIVPNHMGVCCPQNRWWWDVLEHGRNSRFARHFDIFWHSHAPGGGGKILLPVLGDRYARVLERGELQCGLDDGQFTLRYFEHRFPLSRGSVLRAFDRAGLTGGSRTLHPAPDGEVADALRQINADPAALDDLIQQQHYRLAFWRRGDAEINYRRFFSIASLAGVRIEDEKVFADAHGLLRRWLDAGLVDGLRVDHIDGLAEPARYLERLRAIAPRAWIVLEKILGPGERLPARWPVSGTSGYDFSNLVDGLFIDPAGEETLTSFYSSFTGESVDLEAVLWQDRHRVLRDLFPSEVNRLADLLARICARRVPPAAFDREPLREAIVELAANFPVYRTYIAPDDGAVSETDSANIRKAVSSVLAQRPDLAAELEFLRSVLLLGARGSLEDDFIERFQQLTSAVTAKGVEDTAFYRFNRFVALNEVGGDPAEFGVSPESFHAACLARQAREPDAMLSTSSHDTKRSEDVRARLSLLSEAPGLWRRAVSRWAAMNERFRRDGWPDRNAEYLLYQTLFGAWPIATDRVVAYMEKAAREAKQHTNWTDANTGYESALRDFISGALANPQFTRDLDAFVELLSDAGWINSLAKTLLKLTAPGVPDIYQGTELWNFTLVDPDNRRPVDFELRKRLLSEVQELSVAEIWARRAEGLPKLWLIQQALKFRTTFPHLFSRLAAYEPLHASGLKSAHVVSFLRGRGALVVVPRLVLRLGADWAGTALELPAGHWRNVFTGERFHSGRVPLAVLLRRFPVAFLTREN